MYIPILNSRPAACSASARWAMAVGTSLGQPAGVKPEKPMISPLLMNLAASSAVITL